VKDARNNSSDNKSPARNLHIEETMNIKDMGDRIRDYKLDTITSIGGSCRTKNSLPDEEKKFFNS